MQKYDVGVVPVCNDNQTLLGLVTDRDIVVRNIDKKDYINRTEQTTFNQYTLDGNYIQTFFSEKEASIALGYKRLPIHEVCRGERGQAGGFMWRYEKKDKIEPYVKNKKIAPNKNPDVTTT